MLKYKTALEMRIYAREQKVVQDKKKLDQVMGMIETAASQGQEETFVTVDCLSDYATDNLLKLGYKIENDPSYPLITTIKW